MLRLRDRRLRLRSGQAKTKQPSRSRATSFRPNCSSQLRSSGSRIALASPVDSLARRAPSRQCAFENNSAWISRNSEFRHCSFETAATKFERKLSRVCRKSHHEAGSSRSSEPARAGFELTVSEPAFLRKHRGWPRWRAEEGGPAGLAECPAGRPTAARRVHSFLRIVFGDRAISR